MADTTNEVNIGDIIKQLTKASRLVVNTDSFCVLTAAGQAVTIPAEFVRQYLSAAVTPKFRSKDGQMEISYDGGSTWTSTGLSTTKMVTLSQDEYDALVTAGTIDPDTYYNVLEE